MTAARRQKGKKPERDARDLIRAMGIECFKPQDEAEDRGDLILMNHPVTFQIKHYADTLRAIREAIAGAHVQAVRNGHVGIGLVRPNGQPEPGEMLVCFRLHQLADVIDAFKEET